MNILDQIIEHKIKEVEERKSLYPIKLLEQSIYFATQPLSLKKYIQRDDKTGIIAEFKRKSPSKGVINAYASVERTSIGYMQAGAAALSIITDKHFFGGTSEDLTTARKFNYCPILRKDFTIDEYQIVEAKSIGADAILLIAAVLDSNRVIELTTFAHSLDMEVLLEVHNEEELKSNLSSGADLIGVNNRSLKTFEVSIDISKQLAPLIPDSIVKVSESGITSPQTILDLKQFGFQGFLMGENFMKHGRPEKEAMEFMNELRREQEQKNILS
jgi:indole-3-glycerol phosphate synthase